MSGNSGLLNTMPGNSGMLVSRGKTFCHCNTVKYKMYIYCILWEDMRVP